MDSKKTLEDLGFSLCNSLADEGVTYASVIMSKDSSVLYSYSTSPLWDGFYHETGYSKSCHLFAATKLIAEKSNDFILFWDAVVPNNEVSLYLNAKREEKNICHGVSFCKRNSAGILEIVTLAGRKCDINFSSQVMKNKGRIQKFLFV